MLHEIEELISYVKEDVPFGDLTSDAVIQNEEEGDCRAEIIAKENGVIAGISEITELLSYYSISYNQHVKNGQKVTGGTVIMELQGSPKTILLLERTMLNVLERMSGIATATRTAVETATAINPEILIAATRKTAPGLRRLDKKAVIIGGGDPHRWSLSDAILIKDNHLALVPLEKAIRRAKASSAYHLVEVEVNNSQDALTAAKTGADIIMLDNMGIEEIKSTIELLRQEGQRENVKIEVSGNITSSSIAEYAASGVDIISMGSLTHSVKSLDLSLRIRREKIVNTQSFRI